MRRQTVTLFHYKALALKFDFTTSKHSTLRGWFNQMFLKSMAIDISFGKTYSTAFEKRQKADYDDFDSTRLAPFFSLKKQPQLLEILGITVLSKGYVREKTGPFLQ